MNKTDFSNQPALSSMERIENISILPTKYDMPQHLHRGEEDTLPSTYDKRTHVAFMKWLLVLALLVMYSAGRPAAAGEDDDGKAMEAQCKAQVAGKTLEVPLLLWDNSIAFVTVKIAGKPYLFMLDTGASTVCLDSQVARELSKRPGAVQLDRQFVECARITEFRMGNLCLKNVPARTYDFKKLFQAYDLPAQPKLVGLIGGSLLKSFAVTIDLEQRKIFLASATRTIGPRSVTIPFELSEDRPLISGIVDGKTRTKFLVDTGAYQAVFLPKSSLKDRLIKQSGTHEWMDGEDHPAALLRLDVQFGKTLFSKELCEIDLDELAAPDDVTDAEIGAGLLNRFRTTFDYPRRRLILAPNSSSVWMKFAQEGEMFSAHDKYQMAVKSFTSAIDVNPSSPLLYKKRASAYEYLNQDVLAGRDSKRARELDHRP